MERGYVKLWRKVKDSRSHSRGILHRALIETFLVSANWKKGYFCGQEIKPGQLALSVLELSKELKVARSTLQRAIADLVKDEFISVQNMGNRWTLITLINWDVYQTENCELGQPMGNQWATGGHNQRIRESDSPQPPEGAIEFQPPSIEEVETLVREKGYRVDASEFVEKNTAQGWMTGKGKNRKPVANWKLLLSTWNKNATRRNAPRSAKLVMPHAEDIRKINSVVCKRGPWWQLDNETDEAFETRFESMIQECVALGVDESYVREGI